MIKDIVWLIPHQKKIDFEQQRAITFNCMFPVLHYCFLEKWKIQFAITVCYDCWEKQKSMRLILFFMWDYFSSLICAHLSSGLLGYYIISRASAHPSHCFWVFFSYPIHENSSIPSLTSFSTLSNYVHLGLQQVLCTGDFILVLFLSWCLQSVCFSNFRLVLNHKLLFLSSSENSVTFLIKYKINK